MGYTANSDNLAPAILVLIFLTLIISILVICARLGTKLWLQRVLALDDAIILISLAFSTAQSVLLSRAISDGLGQRSDVLTTDQITSIEKQVYGSQLLYVLTLAFAKISIVLFVLKLSPQKMYKHLSWVLGGATTIWTIVSLFTLAFQCAIPTTWDIAGTGSEKCVDRAALWSTIEIINALLDAGIVTLPTVILAGVQTTLSKRLTAISMLACRVVVIAITIPEIVYLRKAYQSTDILFNLWIPIILQQLIASASITCSSMQYLKPFLDSMESGLLRADDGRRHGTSSKGYASKQTPRYGSQMSQDALSGRTSKMIQMKRMSLARQLSSHAKTRRDSDVESQGSESKIIQTRTFEVTSEPREASPGTVEQMDHAL